ncbi:MAG: hypothetical protein ACTSWF_13560 [Candidatus Freyarchaeota archaeon]
MRKSLKDWWLERRKLQWKLRHGLKLTKSELFSAKEIEELVRLLQLLKTGRAIKEKESSLRQRASKVVCDLVFEVIDSKNEPMNAEEIASSLFSSGDELLKSAGYFVMIERVMGGKVPPIKFVCDLLSVCRDKPEDPERTIARLLSKDARFIKVERNLFVLRGWSPNKLFQVYVRLASEYRLTNPKKKERFIKKAIELLESGKADFPNREALMETLKRI